MFSGHVDEASTGAVEFCGWNRRNRAPLACGQWRTAMAEQGRSSGASSIGRRGFFQIAGAAGLIGATPPRLMAQSETAGRVEAQPAPQTESDLNTSDLLVETLVAWGATHAFGIVGDGINPIIEALRKRRDRIAFIGVRHEEAAAFMADGFAKHTGHLGVALATTGPGAIHLMNGLYDAAYDGAPVIAVTGTTFHDLEGMRFMQSVNTVKLMQDVALFDEQVTGPAHAVFVVNRACRAALGGRGVAHLTIAKDIQAMKLGVDKPSVENHGGRSSSSWLPPLPAPPDDQLRAAADLLNAGQRVAILAGQGCSSARDELIHFADALGAPIAKAYLAKALMPDDHPLTTGGIGHLGTAPSSWTMQNCDTIVILGSTMPWIDFYPKPGQARGLQVDIKPDRIGLRYPVELGLTADVRATLTSLQPLLRRKSDRSFLTEAQRRKADWLRLLDRVADTQKGPRLRPQTAVKILSDLAPSDALFSMDCGANTHFAARFIQIRDDQKWTGSGTLVSMASGLPLAIAGAFAYPDRPSIAVVGDGGFAMLMAELSTAVLHGLNVKVMVLNNDSLAQVKFEQHDLGNPDYGCDLGHVDFAAFARAVGAKGFSAAGLADLRPAIKAWLNASGPAVLDVQVDPNEPPKKPDELAA
jgi:pyruvate dehydrogenase (quinone)